jgi:hypothetical protein
MSINASSPCSDFNSSSEPSSPVSSKSDLSRADTASIFASNVGQEDTSKAYENFDRDFLVRLVKARDRAIGRLQSNHDEVTNELKAELKDVRNLATEHHTNWLDLWKKNHALIIHSSQLTDKISKLSIENDRLRKALSASQKICLSAVTYTEQIENENATMKQQLSFIKKSALISLIGLGTVALVATQFKKPQSFGANTLQIIKSLLFDRLIGFHGGAFSLAKGAASEAASIASQKASDVISSAKEAIEGYMSNPSTGSDFTL